MSLSETTNNGSMLSINGSNGSALHAPLNPGSHVDHDREHQHGNGRDNQPLLSSAPLSSSPACSSSDPRSQSNGHSQSNGQHAHVYIHDAHAHSRAHSSQATRDRMLTTSTTSTAASENGSHPVTFTQFKYKLILVPVIFAFLR